jgi:hypothetical protein
MSGREDRRLGTPVMGVMLCLVLFGGLYAYFSLSRSRVVLLAALLLFSVIGVVQAVWIWSKTRLGAAFEVTYVLTMAAVFEGVYRNSLPANATIILATVLYRPNYTFHCNHRLAFIVSVLILATVLPMALGYITSHDTQILLGATYALLVSSLWIFSSKLSVSVFDLRDDPSNKLY